MKIARQCADGLPSLSATDRELLERRIREALVNSYERGRRKKEKASPIFAVTKNQRELLIILLRIGRGTVREIHTEKFGAEDGWTNKTMHVLDRLVEASLVQRVDGRPAYYGLTAAGVHKAMTLEDMEERENESD